jgi:Raf kinase inhibitor-like YbhB/YbcL family protein
VKALAERRDYDRGHMATARSIRFCLLLAVAVIFALVGCGTTPSASAGGPATSAEPIATSTPGGSQPSAASSEVGASTSPPHSSAGTGPTAPFALTSPAFRDGGAIPKEDTCDGAGRSPELRWTGVPSGAKALVLEVIDIDASFIHWLVLDLPPTSPGSLAAGVGTGSSDPQQGTNSFGKVGWGGPCPPSGTHRYVFVLSALAAPLGLAGHPAPATVEDAIAVGTLLARARLTGTYHRG